MARGEKETARAMGGCYYAAGRRRLETGQPSAQTTGWPWLSQPA